MPAVKEDRARSDHWTDLFAGIDWHQRWQVFPRVFTPGRNPVALLCRHIGLPADLHGLRVLDVGALNGCFSFECERRGAEVVALGLDDPERSGFARLHTLLNSRVQYRQQSIYTVDPKVLGVLYHLRYPLLAIDKLRALCRGKVLIESHVIDQHMMVAKGFRAAIVPLKRISRLLPAMPLWRFFPGRELNQDPTNWFGPNIQAVLSAFASAGFDCRLLQEWDDRASFEATPSAPLAAALAGTYESCGDNREFIGL
jgi:tRNA (mo5U34)-methyltransferase